MRGYTGQPIRPSGGALLVTIARAILAALLMLLIALAFPAPTHGGLGARVMDSALR
jgi:hypothetical protein